MKLRENQKGFSLIEIIISIGIMGILITVLLVTFSSSYINVHYSGLKGNSVAEVQEIMEKLYTEIPKLPDTTLDNVITDDKILTYSEFDITKSLNYLLKHPQEKGDLLFALDIDMPIRIQISESSSIVPSHGRSYEITVVKYYSNEDRHIILKSMILK